MHKQSEPGLKIVYTIGGCYSDVVWRKAVDIWKSLVRRPSDKSQCRVSGEHVCYAMHTPPLPLPLPCLSIQWERCSFQSPVYQEGGAPVPWEAHVVSAEDGLIAHQNARNVVIRALDGVQWVLQGNVGLSMHSDELWQCLRV